VQVFLISLNKFSAVRSHRSPNDLGQIYLRPQCRKRMGTTASKQHLCAEFTDVNT